MLVAPLSLLIGVLDQHLICLSNINHEESWSIILSSGCTLFLSREGLFRIILFFTPRAVMALDSKPISHTHRQSQEEECPSHPNATNQMKGGHIVIRCRPEVGRQPKTHTHFTRSSCAVPWARGRMQLQLCSRHVFRSTKNNSYDAGAPYSRSQSEIPDSFHMWCLKVSLASPSRGARLDAYLTYPPGTVRW